MCGKCAGSGWAWLGASWPDQDAGLGVVDELICRGQLETLLVQRLGHRHITIAEEVIERYSIDLQFLVLAEFFDCLQLRGEREVFSVVIIIERLDAWPVTI